MSFLDYINPFNKVADLISEVVEDKDKANEIRRELTLAAEATYNKELDTKTIPWVDALHKMGRQITNYLCIGLAFYMVTENVDANAIMATMAPAGLYAAFKNKGK